MNVKHCFSNQVLKSAVPFAGYTDVVPKLYPSVYQLRDRDTITGVPKFLHSYLSKSARYPNASTFYHDAVDPDLV